MQQSSGTRSLFGNGTTGSVMTLFCSCVCSYSTRRNTRTSRFGWSRWPRPCIRRGAPTPTACTFRRGGTSHAATRGGCWGGSWILPSRSVWCRAASCWRCCNCGAPASRFVFRYDVIPGPKVFETQTMGSNLTSTSRARKWRGASRSKSRSTFGRPNA